MTTLISRSRTARGIPFYRAATRMLNPAALVRKPKHRNALYGKYFFARRLDFGRRVSRLSLKNQPQKVRIVKKPKLCT